MIERSCRASSAGRGAWERDPAGARARLRPGVARRALPLRRRRVGPARRRTRRAPRRPTPVRAAPVALLLRRDLAWLLAPRPAAGRRRRPDAAGRVADPAVGAGARRARAPRARGRVASWTTSPPARAGCASRSRKRSASWCRPGSSPATASRACAACSTARSGAASGPAGPHAAPLARHRALGPLLPPATPASRRQSLEAKARQYVQRYGVVFRDLLPRETEVPAVARTCCASTAGSRCAASSAAAHRRRLRRRAVRRPPSGRGPRAPSAAKQRRARACRSLGLRTPQPRRHHHPGPGPRRPGPPRHATATTSRVLEETPNAPALSGRRAQAPLAALTARSRTERGERSADGIAVRRRYRPGLGWIPCVTSRSRSGRRDGPGWTSRSMRSVRWRSSSRTACVVSSSIFRGGTGRRAGARCLYSRSSGPGDFVWGRRDPGAREQQQHGQRQRLHGSLRCLSLGAAGPPSRNFAGPPPD